MRVRLAVGIAWLLVCGLVVPTTPVAEEPGQADGTAVAPELAPAPAGAPETPEATRSVQPPKPVAEQPEPPEPPPPSSRPDVPAEPEPPPRPIAVAAAPGSVTIEDFSFAPSSVTVGVGETVTWTNGGPSQHTATATDGSFDTGLLSGGQSGSATFQDAGTFSYICTPHPFMKGTVRVVAQSTGAEDGSTPTDGGVTPGASAPAGTSGEDGAGASLPSTGADVLALIVAGLGLLLIGASGRRRTARRA